MKKWILIAAFLFPLSAQAADPAEGYWLTQNERSVIEIKECEEGLCGHVYWIIKNGMQTDFKNPDEKLRKRPMCDLKILWGFNKTAEGAWDDGNIYKADDGDLYSAKLQLTDENTLNVRGFLGFSFLGKTQQWKRVNTADYQQCKV